MCKRTRDDVDRKSVYSNSSTHDNDASGGALTRSDAKESQGRGTFIRQGTNGVCDHEAVLGREGRQETAVVNAAWLPPDIVRCSTKVAWSSKPIVIDIDVPVAVARDEWYLKEAMKGA